jgi:hypothetical protein
LLVVICPSNSVPAKTQLLSHTGRSSANRHDGDYGKVIKCFGLPMWGKSFHLINAAVIGQVE